MVTARLNRVFAVATNTFRESVRERVLYNLVLFAVIVTLSSLLLRPLSIRQEEKIVKDLGLAAMDFFGTLIAVFVGVGLVSKEIERRSLYPLLAKPLGRGEFLVGKFLGLALTLLINTGVMTVAIAGAMFAGGMRFDPLLLKAIIPIYLGLLLIVALALFFSTVTSSALAAVCTVSLSIAGRYSDVLLGMKDVLPEAPARAVLFLYYVLPNFRNFDLKGRVVYGDPVAWAVIGDIGIYAAVYVAAVLIAALLSFRSRDFL